MEGRPLEDRDLIARAKNGDKTAFGELVRVHQGMALRVAYLVLRDHAEAEDVTQDAFVKAYRSLHRFRAEEPFRPWLLKIVRNESLNRSRSRVRRERLAVRVANDPVSGDAASSPETELLAGERRDLLLGLIEGLPLRYREVVVHRYLLGLPERETAQVLRIPVGTVKSRASRALERLRRDLAGRPEAIP